MRLNPKPPRSIPPSMRKPEYTYFEPFHIYSTPLPPSHNKPHDGFDQFGKHAKPPAAPTPAEGGKEGGGRGGGASDQTGQISEQTGQNSGDHASDLRLPSLAERSGADSSMSVGMSEGGRARGGGGGAQVDSLVQQRSIMAEWLGRCAGGVCFRRRCSVFSGVGATPLLWMGPPRLLTFGRVDFCVS